MTYADLQRGKIRKDLCDLHLVGYVYVEVLRRSQAEHVAERKRTGKVRAQRRRTQGPET